MSKSSLYSFILALIVILTCSGSFAQSIPNDPQAPNIDKAKTELQNLFKQWQASGGPVNAESFQKFLSGKLPAVQNKKTYINHFTGQYPPTMWQLPSGGWVLGAYDYQKSIGLWVDVNGGAGPNLLGLPPYNDQQAILLNTNGQAATASLPK